MHFKNFLFPSSFTLKSINSIDDENEFYDKIKKKKWKKTVKKWDWQWFRLQCCCHMNVPFSSSTAFSITIKSVNWVNSCRSRGVHIHNYYYCYRLVSNDFSKKTLLLLARIYLWLLLHKLVESFFFLSFFKWK